MSKKPAADANRVDPLAPITQAAAQATQAAQQNVQAFGSAMTEMWKTMSGLSLPMDAMARLQSDYIA
jgi:hypothetical protein